MSIPTYLFLFTFIPMLIYGFLWAVIEGLGSLIETAPAATVLVSTILIFHALAAGYTALTGIDPVSNGVECRDIRGL